MRVETSRHLEASVDPNSRGAVVQLHESFGLRKRQRIQDYAMYHSEHRYVRTDANPERENAGDGKATLAP
jgi:hypothetical protein